MNLPNHGFGGKNRISLEGDLAVVGAPGAESVFLYLRSAVVAEGEADAEDDWTWGISPVETLMSSNFDYDVVHLKKIVHQQVGVGETADKYET